MDFKANDRIKFIENLETMEVDFSDLILVTSREVDAVYDEIQAALSASGHEKWYFLVNYRDCDIKSSARPAHSRRGSRLNFAHSLGTVRYDASERTRLEIAKRPNMEFFGDNFFTNREEAVERVEKMRRDKPDARTAGRLEPSQYTDKDFAPRIGFLDDKQIMDVDFTNFSFDNNSDVHGFYDFIEKQIAATKKKWYFLVNYGNCRISMKASVSYAQRGKKLNIASSLGSVRYDTLPETEAEIRSRAENQEFRPNIRKSRDEALQRIEEMKKDAG